MHLVRTPQATQIAEEDYLATNRADKDKLVGFSEEIIRLIRQEPVMVCSPTIRHQVGSLFCT
jgi:hypothetical protein